MLEKAGCGAEVIDLDSVRSTRSASSAGSEKKGNHTAFHPGQLMNFSEHSTWTKDRGPDAKATPTFSTLSLS